MLSFKQYKDRLETMEPVGYDAASEKFPYHPWYALNHEKITTGIWQSCQSLLELTNNRSVGDTELDNLHTALEQAKTVSHRKVLCVAFLGEQGIGKSSLICSVLGRDLVQVSSSSSACTAFPTIIAYKDGASDDSQECDVIIQYLNEAEIEDCIIEQGRRYRYAFPRKRQSAAMDSTRLGICVSQADEYCGDGEDRDDEADKDDDDDAGDEEDEVDEDEDDSEDDSEDGDDEEEEEMDETEKEETLNSARTARDFFRIICNAGNSQGQQLRLEHSLEFDDIEGAEFIATCLMCAKERLTSIGAHKGFAKHNAVPDEDLAEILKGAEILWPLVDSVRLETGHVLLRNNLSFLDVPGKPCSVSHLKIY